VQPLLYQPDGGSLVFGNSYVSCQIVSYKCSGIQLSEEFAAWNFRSNIWIEVFLGAAEAPQGGQPNYYQEHLLTYKQVQKSHSDSFYKLQFSTF
jgi:hypothetical protein